MRFFKKAVFLFGLWFAFMLIFHWLGNLPPFRDFVILNTVPLITAPFFLMFIITTLCQDREYLFGFVAAFTWMIILPTTLTILEKLVERDFFEYYFILIVGSLIVIPLIALTMIMTGFWMLVKKGNLFVAIANLIVGFILSVGIFLVYLNPPSFNM